MENTEKIEVENENWKNKTNKNILNIEKEDIENVKKQLEDIYRVID